MSWFKRKPEPTYEDQRRAWHERQDAIRAEGPDQPCMSRSEAGMYVTCETGHPAGTPHQHRSRMVSRMTWEWGTGRGNPFEADWVKRTDAQWLKAAPLGEPGSVERRMP